MNVRFYAIVNKGKSKILLADWCVHPETFEHDLMLYKTGMAMGARLKYKHGLIVCEDTNGKILDDCKF